MITTDKLKEYGANVEEGLSRCLGMEDFYLKLVVTELGDTNFEKLDSAIEAGDTKTAFEAAHALKGTLGNLALTPLAAPVGEITERLRNADSMPDLSDVLPAYKEAFASLKALNE
jgi:HPt (histidine-containing phosphotransfer) domain-containing protein